MIFHSSKNQGSYACSNLDSPGSHSRALSRDNVPIKLPYCLAHTSVFLNILEFNNGLICDNLCYFDYFSTLASFTSANQHIPRTCWLASNIADLQVHGLVTKPPLRMHFITLLFVSSQWLMWIFIHGSPLSSWSSYGQDNNTTIQSKLPSML